VIALAVRALKPTIRGERVRLLRWVPLKVEKTRRGALPPRGGLVEAVAPDDDVAHPPTPSCAEGMGIATETISPRRAAS
jgi:hypothetical protein